MAQLLGLTILSSFITSILLIPFINFLYKLKIQRQHQQTKDPFNKRTFFFDKFHSWKVGTPVGGGALIIIVVCILTAWTYGILGIHVNPWIVAIVLIAFLGYGLLGLYDDFKKLTGTNFWGLRFRHKFFIQWLIAFVIAFIFYFELHYHFIFIRGIGLTSLGFLYIPVAAFVIVAFSNAFNITDGLDGLSSGLFLICLVAFLAIAASTLDTYLGIFIAILMGSVGAFLYFNIYKARIWLGDVGALSLGAVLAVIGLLTGKLPALLVIGGVFVVEGTSSLIQLLSRKYLGRRVFPVAPIHLWMQKRGWEEPKIVMRAWLIGFFFAVLGVYLALIR